MTRFMMAGLLAVSCVLPARSQTAPASGHTYEAIAGFRLIDLDLRGHRGQVQEYDGKLYRGAHGDVSVSNQVSEGLLDFTMKDIGSTEETASMNVDHKSGFKMSGKFQNMHHRLNYMRVGEIHRGVWLPKQAINLLGVAEDQELVMRRTESEFNLGFVSPENNARFIVARLWNVEKSGVMSWSLAGNPNILRTIASVDNTKTDLTLGVGTNIKETGAMNLDIVRSEFNDNAETQVSPVDGGAGSSNNGGVIKRQNGRQSMTGAEFRFRQDMSKDLALTGAFTGRQRDNLFTLYRFNAVVGALNAAYRVNNKLSLLAKLYLRAYQIDENLSYFPGPGRGDALESVDTHQYDKTTVRGEFIANYRPVEKVKLKAAYKLEITNRRDAPSQYYTANRYFSDGYFVGGAWNNEVARNEVKHLVTLGAKVDLPLGIEADAQYKKLRANRPAFVNAANLSDEANASLNVPLPLHLDMLLEGGYLQEKNDVTKFTNYSQVRNTYRAGLDWSGSNAGFFGADISYEAIRYFSELYFGSGNAALPITTATSFHESVMNKQLNTIYGVHWKVICPKGFVILGNGSYTRSTVTTPIHYAYQIGAIPGSGPVNDFTPSNVNIARGSVTMEYTPAKFKSLTARAGYAISDWVDKYDELNSGRSSVAQIGASMKF